MTKYHHSPQKHYRNITLIAFVIILILAGVAVWYFTAGKDILNKTGSGSSTPGIFNTNSASDPTAGWKTAASDQFGFSFQYPAEWTYQELMTKTNQTVLLFGAAAPTPTDPATVDYTDRVIVQVLAIPSTQFIDNQTSLEGFTKSQVLLDNGSVTRIEGIWPRDSLYPEARQTYIIADLGGKTLVMGLQQKKNGTPEILTVFNQLVPTLRRNAQ